MKPDKQTEIKKTLRDLWVSISSENYQEEISVIEKDITDAKSKRLDDLRKRTEAMMSSLESAD